MLVDRLFAATSTLIFASTAAFSSGLSEPATESPLVMPHGPIGFAGGVIGLDYGRATSEAGPGFDVMSQFAALEYSLSRKFSVAVDWENQGTSYGFYDAEGAVATLHGIYRLSDNVMFGVWATRDGSESRYIHAQGLEAAYRTNNLEFQGYLGGGNLDSFTSSGLEEGFTLSGLSASYSFENGFSTTIKVEQTATPQYKDTVTGLAGAYKLDSGMVVFAEATDYSPNDGAPGHSTVSVGLKFEFGPNRGTTFRLREFNDLLAFLK